MARQQMDSRFAVRSRHFQISHRRMSTSVRRHRTVLQQQDKGASQKKQIQTCNNERDKFCFQLTWQVDIKNNKYPLATFITTSNHLMFQAFTSDIWHFNWCTLIIHPTHFHTLTLHLQQKFQLSEFLLLSFIQIPAVKTEHGPDGVEHE